MSTVLVGLLGNTELLLILAIVVIVFGVGKLPQVGRQLGEGIRNFKKELGTETPPQITNDAASAARDVTEEHHAGTGTSQP
ncbi:MAG: twin-arginine translocase TatA/TatE family subunit [Myxococcales bacterium]|nr:twin-arginine translocase TatA/TatE family subunit [Myxococcales bacterium]MCB9531423.1 twin-arginine translocase TatA/TatE family subunit [Myxococcales bacterium]MCB9534066.1 twin-arginine translocase TatA/TatE family subunit [Myxococcales bacterium]